MNWYQALYRCEMYRRGHPVARSICRELARWMWRRFKALAAPGTIGQITFPPPRNFVCAEIICRGRPSVTLSLCGRPADYAGAGVSHLMVPARPRCVRIRTAGANDLAAVLRALGRAAEISQARTLPHGGAAAGPLSTGGSSPDVGAAVQWPTGGTQPTAPTSSGGAEPHSLAHAPAETPSPAGAGEVIDAADAADPDVFSLVGQGTTSTGSPAAAPTRGAAEPERALTPQEIGRELGRIVMTLLDKSGESFARAAADIRRIRPHAGKYPDTQRHFAELVAIWRLLRQEVERAALCPENPNLPPYEATEELPPGAVIPSRPAQLGSGREPLPPPDEVRRWLDAKFGTEDAVREFCCYAYRENEPGAPPQPLTIIGRTPIYGAKVAPLYRERRIERPWDSVTTPDIALLRDFLLVRTVIDGRGELSTQRLRRDVRRVRPYLRSIPDELLIPLSTEAADTLVRRNLLRRTSARMWLATREGSRVCLDSIRPLWVGACTR
jgi:hypothetical protein